MDPLLIRIGDPHKSVTDPTHIRRGYVSVETCERFLFAFHYRGHDTSQLENTPIKCEDRKSGMIVARTRLVG